MAVYDDEKDSLYNGSDDYTPETIRNAENSATGSTDDEQKKLLDNLTEDERELYDSLTQGDRDIFLKLKKEDQELDKAQAELNDRLNSFYKEDEGGSSKKSGSSFLGRGGNKKKIGIILAAFGAPTLVFAVAFIPGLLSIFKLENFLQNIDSATFARFNASFEGRSDKWIKSYIKLRMTELDGGTNPGSDTLYFRSNLVDTNNPIRDWYRTLRTSKFEQEVFEKNGIRFTTAEITGPDGSKRFVPAKMTIRDVPLTSSRDIELGFEIADALDGDPNKLEDLRNRIGPEIDKFVDTELFSSNKEARRAIKQAVNDNSNSWNVFKRRHVRKDIQNMTGIKSWRMFERTRDKIDAKQIDMQVKIMQIVLPSNRTGIFIGCIFGVNKCPGQGDPASPESRDPGRASANSSSDGTSEAIDENGNAEQVAVDPNNPDAGNTTTPSPDGSPEVAAKDVAQNIGNSRDSLAADLAGLTPAEKFIKSTVAGLVGNPYTKVWSSLRKIAHIHNLFANNTLGNMVLQATRMQYMAAYASMAMSLSQMKSGDIQGTENLLSLNATNASFFSKFANTSEQGLSLVDRNGQVSQYMKFFDNAERSEAWILYSQGGGGNSARAFAATENSDKGRGWYCDLKESERKKAPVHYKCPEDGLNGGRADELKKAYDASVGIFLAPIAGVVNAVEDSFLGGALNMVSGVMDRLAEATIAPIINKLLDSTGTGDAIGDVMTAALGKLMTFAGAGVKYFGGKAGQLNYMMMGGSLSAESTTRLSGGIASTQASLAYSNKQALEWKKEKQDNMSTYDKFLALSNPTSIASKGLMAISTSSPKNIIRDALNPSKSLGNYASLMSSAVYAEESTNTNASSVAEWGGIPTYDIPQTCIDLEPLSSDYLAKATNAPEGVPRDYATLSDSTKFWDSVYENLDGLPDEKEQKASQIYNCALLDARVMGSLGYLHGGYDKDAGLDNTTGSGGSPTTSPVGGNINFIGSNGYTIPCKGEAKEKIRLPGKRGALDWSNIRESGIIGKNSDNKDIKVYIRESCTQSSVKTVVIVGSIHGSENGGQLVAHDLLFNATLPDNVRIVVIPELNGSAINTLDRNNKNGVDLNRNFPYRWSEITIKGENNPSSSFYRGPSPASEKETQAAMSFLENFKNISVLLVYHHDLNYTTSVGKTSPAVGKVYADAARMKNSNDKGATVVSQHGSLDLWFNQTTNTPTVLVELAVSSLYENQTKVDEHVNAVITLANNNLIKGY